MAHFIKRFRKDEAGAVTVDWVVLTAAVVALAVGVSALLIGNGTTTGVLSGLRTSIENATGAIDAANESVAGEE